MIRFRGLDFADSGFWYAKSNYKAFNSLQAQGQLQPSGITEKIDTLNLFG